MIYAGADLHIEKSIRQNRVELQKDGFNALNQFKDAILKDNCKEKKTVLLAGDVFNRNSVNGEALKALEGFVDTLWQNRIETYAITGNHDGDYGPSILETQGVESLQGRYVKIDGRIVTGLNYASRDILKASLAELSSCDILVLHSPFAHLLGFEGSYQLTLDELPKNIPVTIVGDVHVKDFREYAPGCYFISPGALHACAIDQGSIHGFFKLSIKDPINAWQFQTIPTRQIIRFKLRKIESIKTVKDTLDKIKKVDLKPVVELRYASTLNPQILQLEATYKDKFIFIKKPNISGKILEGRRTDLDDKSDLKKFTMLDVLPYSVDPKEDPENFAFLEELLTTQDPEAFLQKHIDEIE